jgi:hypothetical protein
LSRGILGVMAIVLRVVQSQITLAARRTIEVILAGRLTNSQVA